MKLIAICAIAVLIPAPVNAQQYEGCWMINPAGQYVNLSSICDAPQTLYDQTIKTPSIPTPEIRYEDVSTADPVSLGDFSASKYCDWREAGGRSREESREYANRELVSYLFNTYGPDGASQIINSIGSQIATQQSSAIQEKCPNDA